MDNTYAFNTLHVQIVIVGRRLALTVVSIAKMHADVAATQRQNNQMMTN